ncbi:hypothetical protein [Pantoea agglomerans]|uniref:hypothetical protein n=1 Tax=Enterobacter agglomerans TaxID=549 RepID=UPI0012DAD651|nr:hypothetical protein [Pantoea agglomerans]WHU90646.1 hypothetical protein A7P62_22945 [Pantoea agglomerans pv. gypsophilae]
MSSDLRYSAYIISNSPESARETYRDEGSSSAVPSTPSEITEENDDTEFEQLHQQRLARERNNPLPRPNGPVARRSQPTLTPIAENMPEEAEASQKLPLLKTQPPLKGVPSNATPPALGTGRICRPTLGEPIA